MQYPTSNKRKAVADRWSNARRNIARVGTAVVGAGMSALAFAQSDPTLADQAVTAIDGAKPQITLVQGAMIGVLVLIVIFALIKLAMRK
jgi:hypothetical protein